MIKNGVDLSGLKPEMAVADNRIIQIYHKHGSVARITSGLEGKHSYKSLHYVGYALDYGIRGLAETSVKTIYKEIANALGDQYDVILEDDHIHVEFQPKS